LLVELSSSAVDNPNPPNTKSQGMPSRTPPRHAIQSQDLLERMLPTRETAGMVVMSIYFSVARSIACGGRCHRHWKGIGHLCQPSSIAPNIAFQAESRWSNTKIRFRVEAVKLDICHYNTWILWASYLDTSEKHVAIYSHPIFHTPILRIESRQKISYLQKTMFPVTSIE
jgi:hypothetical protein